MYGLQAPKALCVLVAAAAGAWFPNKKCPWICWNMYFVYDVFLAMFGVFLSNVHHMVDLLKWPCQQDARRNSVQTKTCCNAPIFVLSLICYVIPGMIEPWPECQPEKSWE